MISRRRFTLSLAALVALPSTLISGCAFSVSDTISTIITAIGGILSYVGSSQPWAAALQAALAALQTQVAAWKAGGAAQYLIDALNAVEAVLAVIPLTAVYSPLIDLIVSGIEAIINYFAPTSAGPGPMSIAKSPASGNPHKNRIALKAPGALQSPVGAFKSQWNDACVGLGLAQLKLS
jgi:hypothetical protein